MRDKRQDRVRRPFVVRCTLADRLLASGQRLRANETAVALTFQIDYAAKWAQNAGGAR